MIKRVLLACTFLCGTVAGAEIVWINGELTEETDVSNAGTVVEAFAFTGDRDNNALPEAGAALEDEFVVNGTTFTPLNFSLGDAPEFLDGLTYDNGEFGHTAVDEGLLALQDGLAFESGTGEQFMDLTGLTEGQGYLVEFYYYHRNTDRAVTLDDGMDNSITLIEGNGVGGYAAGYFVADSANQEINSVASTGSHYLNGYQLREVSERPFELPEPPPPSEPRLIGYWNFDGNTEDQSGMGNHGTIFGGVDYSDDVPAAIGEGSSAEFDGVEGTYVAVEHNQMMPVTSHTDFTISMWVRGDGTVDNVDDRVFSEGLSTDNNPLFNLGTQNAGEDGRFDFYYRNGSSPGHLYSEGDAFDDDWHHIVWVDEDNVGTLYIDGSEDSTFDYSSYPELMNADQTAIGAVLRATDCCNFTGNIDEVAIYSFALDEAGILALLEGTDPASLAPSGVPGDFDGDGLLTAVDIDALHDAFGGTESKFDLNTDGAVNTADARIWVEELKNTYFGDANLDGEFGSADFVTVFVAGKFETGEAASWAEGDWDFNGTFDSGDFVAAFTGGGFEQGPRAGVASVPEPGSSLLLLFASAGIAVLRRRR